MSALLLALSILTGRQVCDNSGGPWLLVYRYSYTDDDGQRITREQFDGERFPTVEDAYCWAAKVRQTGVVLPTLERYGRDSNVMPEVITPMPTLHTEAEK